MKKRYQIDQQRAVQQFRRLATEQNPNIQMILRVSGKTLLKSKVIDAMGKAERVAKSLHTEYYPGQEFDASCYIRAGSFGKGTATRPPVHAGFRPSPLAAVAGVPTASAVNSWNSPFLGIRHPVI